MDPQVKSLLTSLGLSAATALSAWAVSKGLIPGADQASFANDLVALASGLVAIGLAWWKARQLSQPAMVQAVNQADNGVKVVSAKSASQQVVLDPKTGAVMPDPTAPPVKP